MPAKKAPAAEPSSNGVLPKLKAVYEFMTLHNLEAIELDEAGSHVKMVRRKAAAPMPVPVPVMMTGTAPVSVAPTPATVSPGAAHVPAQPSGIAVKSSMMGIFYRAASPSSPPFVKEGDAVKAGQILCMVEAMKVFNEIKAEYPCTVVKVLLENGKPVKAGQDIFLVQR